MMKPAKTAQKLTSREVKELKKIMKRLIKLKAAGLKYIPF